MAVIAAAVNFIARMLELQSDRRELVQLDAVTLCQNGMAGIAIAGLHRALAIGGFVLAVMATETAGPILVADIVRVAIPTRVHFGEEIVFVDLLRGGDRSAQAGLAAGQLIGRITLGQNRRDALQGLRVVRVRLRQGVQHVRFDIRQAAIEVPK